MEQEFIGRRSMVAELSQRGDSFTTDTNAAKNHDTFLTRWQTVDAQIQVSFIVIFRCDILHVLIYAVHKEISACKAKFSLPLVTRVIR